MSRIDSEEAYLVDQEDEPRGVKSNLCCFKKAEPRLEFSIQSGDIQRVTPEDETEDVVDVNTLSFKGKFIHMVHQTIYKVVRIFFANFIPPLVTLFILFAVPLTLILLAAFVYPPQVDLSLRSFQIPNHESSRNYDAFQMALDPYVATSDNDNSDSRRKRACTRQQSLQTTWALDLYYVSKDGGNILTPKRIGQIHNVEQNVVKHKYSDLGYENVCHRSNSNSEECDPLNSLLTFFYPRIQNGKYVFDGNGDTLQDINSTLALAFQIESSYWYGDFKNNNTESKYLRSQLRIGVPILNYCRYKENAEVIHEIISDYFISFISYLDSASTE